MCFAGIPAGSTRLGSLIPGTNTISVTPAVGTDQNGAAVRMIDMDHATGICRLQTGGRIMRARIVTVNREGGAVTRTFEILPA